MKVYALYDHVANETFQFCAFASDLEAIRYFIAFVAQMPLLRGFCTDYEIRYIADFKNSFDNKEPVTIHSFRKEDFDIFDERFGIKNEVSE